MDDTVRDHVREVGRSITCVLEVESVFVFVELLEACLTGRKVDDGDIEIEARLLIGVLHALHRACSKTKCRVVGIVFYRDHAIALSRSEEHTSELQSLMRISYAVFCLKKKR